jgi:predicted MFS family arabinose efflux permease
MSARVMGSNEKRVSMVHTDSTVRDYWIAWVATLLFFVAFYALLVPLPGYLEYAGMADWQIGVVLGAFGIASLIGRPLAGVLTDRWGARRVLLGGGLALALGAAAVSLTRDMALLFGLRLLQAAGYVAFTTAGTALVVALTGAAERGRRLAVFGIAANVAMTSSPALTSVILPLLPLSAAFGAIGALALIPALAIRFIHADRVAAPQTAAIDLRRIWQFPHALRLPMLIAGCFGVGFGAFFQFATLLAERRGTIPAGVLYTCYGIGIILTRLLSRNWMDRAGVVRILTFAAILKIFGLALAALAVNPFLLAAAAFLIAAGSGLFHPALIAHHVRILPAEPGRATAGFYVGFDLGIGAGNWFLGLMLQWFGLTGLYSAAMLAVLAGLALVPALERGE